MNKSSYLLLGAALIATSAIFLLLQPSVQSEQADAADTPVTVPDPEPDTGIAFSSSEPDKPVPQQANAVRESAIQEQYPEIAQRLDAMQARRPRRNFDPEAVVAAVKRDTAWTPAEEPPENLPLKEEEMTDGRQFIQFDSLKLETLMPGDSVKVAIEETGREYKVVIDRVEKHNYNSISWHGHINGRDGQTYTVSFTRGEFLTVGGLETPDGHYVVQAHGNDGWLASSATLFKFDPNVSDVMYPHEEGQHNAGQHP